MLRVMSVLSPESLQTRITESVGVGGHPGSSWPSCVSFFKTCGSQWSALAKHQAATCWSNPPLAAVGFHLSYSLLEAGEVLMFPGSCGKKRIQKKQEHPRSSKKPTNKPHGTVRSPAAKLERRAISSLMNWALETWRVPHGHHMDEGRINSRSKRQTTLHGKTI